MDKERLFRYLDRNYSSKSEIIPGIPLGEDTDAIWSEILLRRRERSIELPLVNVNGEPYWYILTNKMIAASEVIVNELMEQESTAELHNRSVSTIEEIYYTGFMEGAQISVQDAMEFLQSGNEPESVEELILLNSRQAAGFAAENMYHAIDSNYLHNLAYFLTEGLDNGSGDYRITDTVEIPSLQGEVIQLPPAAMIPEQTERFAGFLADTATHPLIKAAVAQAWMLAYRPFPEGNERLARLLSNVILIRAGYTFFGNISISSVLAQTSYEYFRAIANILRTENGADLTYFLEYYLVSLSTAVSDMKTKRIQQAETVAEAEQKMAMVKLDDHLIHENVSQLEGSETEPVSGYERLKEALDSLRLRGYTQFTANDVREICGMSRKYVHTLLMRFEAEAKITIIRKANTGNIYAFVSGRQDNTDSHHGETNKPAAIINDGTTGDSVSDTNSEETAETKEYVSELYSVEYIIQALQDGMTENNEIFAKIANQLIKYLKAGKQQFKVPEISAELDLHVSYIRGAIMWCRKKNLVEVVAQKHKIFTYAFRTKISSFASANEQPDERSTVLFDKLNMLTSSDDEKVSLFAYIFLEFLYTGKQAFTTDDIAEQASEFHLENYQIHNGLRAFRKMGIIENMNKSGNSGSYRLVLPDIDKEKCSKHITRKYSKEVLHLIASLERSNVSQKDRRIGAMLRSCLEQGYISKKDYEKLDRDRMWSSDMKFAVQLGIVKAVSKNRYKILKQLDTSPPELLNSQKTALTAMYDLFGEDAFSAEMLIANLDYSSAHASGILHQFTWLKMLSCSKGENNRMSYQFIVNPEDNPECFVDAA